MEKVEYGWTRFELAHKCIFRVFYENLQVLYVFTFAYKQYQYFSLIFGKLCIKFFSYNNMPYMN